MMDRTTVRLPRDLMRLATRKAAEEGRTLTALIEDGLRQMVVADRRPSGKKRVLPRVSKARGDTLPGIDITSSAALQEMDDLDYVERMKRIR
jgi:hypothetical protein